MTAEKSDTKESQQHELIPSREEIIRQTAEMLRVVAEGVSGKITSAEEALREHVARKAAEQPPAPEEISAFAQTVLESDLAYQDAEAPEEIKNKRLEWVKSSENAKLYANAIVQLTREPGQSIDRIRDSAQELVHEVVAEAKRIGMPVSPETKSISWAMWDIGKQHAYWKTKGEIPMRQEGGHIYQVGDPLSSSEKRKEMSNRQLGWEAYKQYHSESSQWKADLLALRSKQEGRGDWVKVTSIDVTLMLLDQPPKTNGTLSSYELAQLGGMVRMLDPR